MPSNLLENIKLDADTYMRVYNPGSQLHFSRINAHLRETATDLVVIDTTRAASLTNSFYANIENILNGNTVGTLQVPGGFRARPWVLVFANQPPDYKKITPGKFKVIDTESQFPDLTMPKLIDEDGNEFTPSDDFMDKDLVKCVPPKRARHF
jgi:hypothetical protein